MPDASRPLRSSRPPTGHARSQRAQAGVGTDARRGSDRAGFAADLTARHPDLAALRSELDEIEAIYRTAPVALGALDLDLRWLRVSDRMAALSGIPAAAHRGRPVAELPPDLGAKFAPACERVLATAAPVIDHEVVGRPPGADLDWTLRVSCFPIVDATGRLTGVNLFARDVTGLLAVERLRDTFIGVLSHELRTPATSIYTAGVLLRRIATDERVAGLAADMAEEADHLVRIMENLLVLARVERGASVVDQSEPALVQHVLRREVEAERTRRPDARIDLEVGADLAPVACDAEQIALVVRNLLSNAVKYGRRGGCTRVTATASDAGGVIVRVLDDGPGIGNGDPARLFDLYYRAPTAAAAIPGAGIGLFVCRAVVEAAGGRIGALPGLDGGAEFWFEIPAFADTDGMDGVEVVDATDRAIDGAGAVIVRADVVDGADRATDGADALRAAAAVRPGPERSDGAGPPVGGDAPRGSVQGRLRRPSGIIGPGGRAQ